MIHSPLRHIVKSALGFSLLFALAPALAAPPPSPEVRALLGLRALDARVARIGHRLAVSSLDLCGIPALLPGLFVHDLSQYGGEYRAAAVKAFGLGRGPAILAVAPGSAAARAGIMPDDVLLSIDGAAPDPKPGGSRRAGFDTVERILDGIDEAVADGRAELRLFRAGKELLVQIQPERGCASRFQILPSRELNARADGRYVQVTSALAEYAASDDDLAAVLAHELAHNILRHRSRLDAAGISRGVLKQLGRNARLIRQTEIEADQLSIYLLDRAGYAAAAAPRFWGRFGRQHEGLLFASPTHPRWKQRVAALEEGVHRLYRLKRETLAPRPSLLAAPLPELK